MMKQWYEEFFELYSSNYENEEFTKGTTGEVDFLEKEAGFDKSKTILDIGCGTGRHSIEISRRGYRVTGIDLSKQMLEKAAQNSKKAGVDVLFIQADARNFISSETFDLAVMLCEGGFPLMETDEMNFSILKTAYHALKKGGKFIFTTLNGLYPLFHSVKDFINENSNGNTSSVENNFDLMTFRDHSRYEFTDNEGNKRALKCNERYYVPSEINWLLTSLGFINIHICAARLGCFNREHVLSAEDYEMLVIAEKD